jgi:hypothetical protein
VRPDASHECSSGQLTGPARCHDKKSLNKAFGKGERQLANPKDSAFMLNQCFPEASALFSVQYRPLADIKKSCLVTLDTNVLLAPYGVGSESLKAIRDTYEALLRENRLFVSGHVAREFARRKDYMLAELAKSISDQSSRARALLEDNIEVLRGLPIYQEAVKNSKAISDSIQQCRKQIVEVIDTIRSWQSNDPVSALYRELFSGVVQDLDFDDTKKEELLAEFNYRTENKIPPGYKDEGKKENAEGDFLIWKTILKNGKDRKSDMVFVTDEEKQDWWIRAGGRPYFPRPELLDEYRRMSDGHTFHILSFPQFLSEFGAPSSVVEEVEKVEIENAVHRLNVVERRYAPLNDEETTIRDIVSQLSRASQLEIERISLQRNLRRLEAGLSRLPLDANQSLTLPWNRTAHGLRSRIAEVEERLAAIQGELSDIDAHSSES